MRLITLLFSPREAISRGQFAWGLVISAVLVMLVVTFLWFILTIIFVQKNAISQVDIEATLLALRSMHAVESYHFVTLYTQLVLALFLVGKLVLVWIHVCLVLKRLTDLEISRWWAVLLYTFTLPGWITLPEQYDLLKYACWSGLAVFYCLLFFWSSRILHEPEGPKIHNQGFFALLFSPHGSIQRMQFLGGMLVSGLLPSVVLMIFALILKQTYAVNLSVMMSLSDFYTLLQTYGLVAISAVGLGSAFLSMLWIQLCVTLKRLSDLMVSRWFALIFYLSPMLALIQAALESSDIHINVDTAVSLLNIVVLCLFLVLLIWPTRRRSIEI